MALLLWLKLASLRKEPAQQKGKPKAAAQPPAAKPDDAGKDGERGPEADDAGKDGEREDAPRAENAPQHELPGEKPKVVSGMAAGTNFAGRSPPGTFPWSTRFSAIKQLWVECLALIQYATNTALHAFLDRERSNLELRHIHPQIKPGCYVKSQARGSRSLATF